MNIKDYVQEICPTTTQQWIKEGAFLLDVREPYEIQMMAFDVPKILHIPYSQFEVGCEISESNDNSCCNTDNLSDNSCCSSENKTNSKCC